MLLSKTSSPSDELINAIQYNQRESQVQIWQIEMQRLMNERKKNLIELNDPKELDREVKSTQANIKDRLQETSKNTPVKDLETGLNRFFEMQFLKICDNPQTILNLCKLSKSLSTVAIAVAGTMIKMDTQIAMKDDPDNTDIFLNNYANAKSSLAQIKTDPKIDQIQQTVMSDAVERATTGQVTPDPVIPKQDLPLIDVEKVDPVLAQNNAKSMQEKTVPTLETQM